MKLVWFAAKEKEKVEKRPGQAERAQQETLGTMGADVFLTRWLTPVCSCLQACQLCSRESELHEALLQAREKSPPDSRCSEEECAEDARYAVPLLGRKPIMIMDGAKYHVRTNPGWVRRDGPGGIYGARGAGRGDEKSACAQRPASTTFRRHCRVPLRRTRTTGSNC